MGKKYYLVTVIGIFMQFVLQAQPDRPHSPSVSPGNFANSIPSRDTLAKRGIFMIGKIVLNGNHKTKFFIIERELPFKVGDSVALTELVQKFELARVQLMNTRLFNDVVVSLKGFKGYDVEVQIDIKERWYLFPLPYFKLADRNLSEWKEQGYQLKRSNYGAKFDYYNFTGRNDKLKAWFITGYTHQIQLSYEQPNADKSLKHGYGIYMSYATSKQLNQNTFNNQQQFIPMGRPMGQVDSSISDLFKGQVLNELFNIGVSYTYRPAIKTRHMIRLSYNVNRVDEVVIKSNPNYFNHGKTTIAFPQLDYFVDYTNVDYVAYPLKGFMGGASFSRRGINSDMNVSQFTARGTQGFQLTDNTFYGLQAYGVLKLPFNQPYANSRLFGYGDLYLRGLEKYVIDGVAGLMVRNTIREKILSFDVPFSFSKSHNIIPFKVYLKAYGDMGYAYNKNFTQNSLVNRMMYTTGAGIDFVTLYDVVIRFEYSFNQMGQNGLFLHFKNDF